MHETVIVANKIVQLRTMAEEMIDDSGIETFHCSDTEDDVTRTSVVSKAPVHSFRILLVKDAALDTELVKACQSFKVPISIVEDFGSDGRANDALLSVYVVTSFDGIPDRNENATCRIVGRSALLEIAKKYEDGSANYALPFTGLLKPLYSHAMSGQVICFAGFKKMEELVTLKTLVNFMGGRVRKDMNADTTHLVAKFYKREKFTYAMLFNVPIVSEMWVQDAWQRRDILGFDANDADFVSKYKLKIFFGSKICFLGFPEEEKNHMIEVLKENGGEPVDLTDATCTHMVVDEMKIVTPPPLKSTKAFVVKAEWFWSSIQYERRQNELDFKVDGCNQPTQNSIQSPNLTALNFSGGSLSSGGGNRKRKRKSRIGYAILAGVDSSPQSGQKQRRSSVADLTKVSENSFLDYTTSSVLTNDDAESVTSEKSKTSKTSKRYHKFLELWQTETNYVGILRTIMTLFKADLEAMVDKKEQLLNATEMKIIFGHLPPIYTTHCRMLDDLNQMIANWNEDSSIGSLISKYSNDLEKAYPPFINFFENTRDMLIKCDRTKPRFHAFLKLRQSKPECGRQSLQDLLIRPVQRLPSINLLLNDILRNTPQTSVDYEKLDAAIKEIQNVMTYINEDKKRTEGQVALFDIFNEIEKCPADLVSSQRCFISRCEVTELSDDLSGKGNPLVLFLFSDVIEVCKKRTKAFSKENNGSVSSKHGNGKLYKHVDVIPLSSILKVIDIKETDDCRNIFALIVRRNHDTKESEECVYSFTITDSTGADKCKYLRSLCHQIANIVCTTDTESYFMQLEAQQLDIDSSDVTTGSLGKAFNKFASKTRVKVGRALSFNKTPSKLRRAMSTMMSPFGSQNGLTPSSQLANLQLAALPPIPTFGEESHSPNTPSRKMKSASFSMGSLRRL